MHIKLFEVANFRKLLAVRIDLSRETTLFVGANNSGKTSAMLALRKFLRGKATAFDPHDLTLCHWSAINAVGDEWLKAAEKGETIDVDSVPWSNWLPALDIWFHVDINELHYVRDILPTLDWTGGAIGVRLRLEPDDPEALYRDFSITAQEARAICDKAKTADGQKIGPSGSELTIWPTNLMDFLGRRLATHFDVRTYVLDPEKLQEPVGHQARLQELLKDAVPVDGFPTRSLIRVDEIGAQRGFGEPSDDGPDEPMIRRNANRLSDQLRAYYKKHLDPTDRPDENDIGALQAIATAQAAFDARLTDSFAVAFSEVQRLGYPGVTDPRPKVSTRLQAIDGLDHAAAVSFEIEVIQEEGVSAPVMRLPEGSNGLGYQNLISMIFRLMSFRDGWMRVGKAKDITEEAPAPLHLVLVEEPEAHLHAQVQQVFIGKAYDVLRAHPALGDSAELHTQLIVSTHSIHVAHEASFADLRYFRRLPAGMVARVPVTEVINLSDVFGAETETTRFVTRYLRAQHADLFFADAAILVEGPAERIVLPNFIRHHFPRVGQSYVTLLEIGGSHAHKLRQLIERLGLLTLIITDLDSLNPGTKKAECPKLGSGQLTNNATLKTWLPAEELVDTLAGVGEEKRIKRYDKLFAVRVCYQQPVTVTNGGAEDKVCPYTFEDALVYANVQVFKELEGDGLLRKCREALNEGAGLEEAATKMFEALRSGRGKAEFALNVIESDRFGDLRVPPYIQQGLAWIDDQLGRRQGEILATVPEVTE